LGNRNHLFQQDWVHLSWCEQKETGLCEQKKNNVPPLDNLQEVEAIFQGKRFVLRSQVLGEAHKAFMAAGVALPPTLREKL